MAGTRDFYTMKMLARIADAPDGIAAQLSLSEAYGGSGATSVSSKDLNALEKAVKALRAALSVPAPGTGDEEHRDLVAQLRAHADTQIEDNLAYIQRADRLMRRAANALDDLEAIADSHARSLNRELRRRQEREAGDLGAVKVKPAGWLLEHPEQDRELSFFRLTEADKEHGWRETPLYLSSSPVGEMVLVPREPTEAMYKASYSWFGSSAFNFGEMYRAMLASSPQGGR